jgi:dTDP-4-amino-4,6-dideoxygalactose transaminase
LIETKKFKIEVEKEVKSHKEQIAPERIWLSSPHMGGNEQRYVAEAFESNWVAPIGGNIDALEKQLAKYVDVKASAALSSGTSALHLALKLCGVERGDFVICQSLTFVATANAILYEGGQPIFVDSEEETWGMDPALLEKAIVHCVSLERKPKAIIPVHLYGMPVKMNEILAIAKKYRIPVIEDAAEALGSSIGNRMCGSMGDFGVISFNGNKIITTSGGGMLLSNSIRKIEKAKFYATQARDNAPHYQHSEIGYNYRMSNILAGIGRGQMEVLEDRIQQRRENFAYYKEALSDIPGISFLKESKGTKSNRWLTIIVVDPSKTFKSINREDIRLALEKANIESRPLWKPMHMQPLFEKMPYFGKGIAMKLFKNGLCLPSGSNLTLAQKNRVVEVIRSLFQ